MWPAVGAVRAAAGVVVLVLVRVVGNSRTGARSDVLENSDTYVYSSAGRR